MTPGKVLLVSKGVIEDSQVLNISGYSCRSKICEMWMHVQNWNFNKSKKDIIWCFELLKIGNLFLNFNVERHENI